MSGVLSLPPPRAARRFAATMGALVVGLWAAAAWIDATGGIGADFGGGPYSTAYLARSGVLLLGGLVLVGGAFTRRVGQWIVAIGVGAVFVVGAVAA